MPFALIVLQLAAAEPLPAAALPTIELHARVRARELTIAQQGEARLEVHAAPALEETVKVERNQPKGQQSYRNVDLTLRARATLADPAATAPAGEPAREPQASARPPGG